MQHLINQARGIQGKYQDPTSKTMRALNQTNLQDDEEQGFVDPYEGKSNQEMI